MAKRSSPSLSKSRFNYGLQCLKRLYLETFNRDLADPISPQQQALFDSGTAVGELARERFSPGLLIDEQYFEHGKAMQHTDQSLEDDTIKTLFEAAFSFEGINIRADILHRNDDGSLDLIEVKSSTSFKKEHLPDVAIQLHVVEGLGHTIRKSALMHIDNSYIFDGGPYDLGKLFAVEDVSEQAQAYAASEVPERLNGMWAALQGSNEPDIETGPHCSKPYVCSFYGYCHGTPLPHAVEQLPSVSAKTLSSLKDAGIQEISNIPDAFEGLTNKQQRVRDSVVSGEPYKNPELSEVFKQLVYPLYFLDFETVSSALPLHAGTRPYQQVTFQWSIHKLSEAGDLEHSEYLHDQQDDPREALAVQMLDALESRGAVVVYTGFEEARIRELADALPEHRERLLALCDRIFDLYKALNAHYYHPDFHGSWSIKSVLPALVPSLSYSGLAIKDGGVASLSFSKMVASKTSEKEKSGLREALLRYCERDTEAMVKIFDYLQTHGSGAGV